MRIDGIVLAVSRTVCSIYHEVYRRITTNCIHELYSICTSQTLSSFFVAFQLRGFRFWADAHRRDRARGIMSSVFITNSILSITNFVL